MGKRKILGKVTLIMIILELSSRGFKFFLKKGKRMMQGASFKIY